MHISPISFGSLMVFRLKKKNTTIPELMQVSFDNNPNLQKYSLQSPIKHEEKIDGTVHNAALNFARQLDKKYAKQLKISPDKVFLTQVEFYVNPRDTETRYFLTGSDKGEQKIHQALCNSGLYYCQKFRKY